ncbi:MAG: SCO family protein [Planctomycetota bacterium]|nr:SCO family protein [Planctomycetota bacterium]
MNPSSEGRPGGLLVPAVLGVLALAALGVAILAYQAMTRVPTATARAEAEEPPLEVDAQLAGAMRIPDFALVDQTGLPRSREDFKGRFTILAFTFTNCPTACPIMHSQIIRLQEELRGTPVRIVSISVDPERDTPEALRAHAERLGAEPSLWSFWTGDPAVVRSIVSTMGFALVDDPNLIITLPDGGRMNNIVHPTKLLLIGPDVSVLAMESGLEWGPARRLAELARRLALSKPAGN